MAERIVTCDIQMEREILRFFGPYLISALRVHPLWHGGCQGDNRFLPIPTATCHEWFMRVQWWFIFAAQAGAVEWVHNISP